MNSKQWRKLGYMTIFRGGFIYLVRKAVPEIILRTKVNNGEWMGFEKVNEKPWESVQQFSHSEYDDLVNEFTACAEVCYCDKGVDLCDFCGTLRSPVNAY